MSATTIKMKSRMLELGLALLLAAAGPAPTLGAADAAMAFPWQVPKLITEQWNYHGPSGVARDASGRILWSEFTSAVSMDGHPVENRESAGQPHSAGISYNAYEGELYYKLKKGETRIFSLDRS